jgi:hypothetical protein
MGQQQLLLIIVGAIILGIAIAIGVSLFFSQNIESNRDAIVNDISAIAEDAYKFNIRPSFLGGGNGSYTGYTIPTKLSSNLNAVYTTPSVGATVTIKGQNASAPNQWVQAILDAHGVVGTFTYGTDFQ